MHLRDESKAPGEGGYNKLSMFKAILLGQWHSLSDPKLEEALRGSLQERTEYSGSFCLD